MSKVTRARLKMLFIRRIKILNTEMCQLRNSRTRTKWRKGFTGLYEQESVCLKSVVGMIEEQQHYDESISMPLTGTSDKE